jgi:hypothetical protein
MPDGDRFERRLRGRGWRTVYRLGCSSAPLEAVVDKIMGAVAHLFRAEDTKVVRDIYCELQDASQLLGTRLLTGSVSEQAFDQLSFAAGVIKEDARYSELARFAERAALRTFNEMDQSGEHWDDDALKQRFTRNLVWDLGERRCFSVTREGIMESAQRDHRAQLAWESKVRDTILGPSATISKSLLADEGNVMVRAPKRLFKPKPVTMETLTAPLQVLETPR